MALQTEPEELLAAWRALTGVGEGAEGWRTIPLLLGGPGRLRAGRRFPGNEESLLVRFTGVNVRPADDLPQGQGFLVSLVDSGVGKEGECWLALSRRQEGSLELFAMMAVDIVSALEPSADYTEERLFQKFLSRIRAWQEFMRRGRRSVLDTEAEIGLVGELLFLEHMVGIGVRCATAVEGWVGPLRAPQDFVLGPGAIEVKATVAVDGFPVRIGSLVQLDDSLLQPLFLAAVRVRSGGAGRPLPSILSDVRELLADEPTIRDAFNSRLLHAGYFDGLAEHYQRQFTHVETRVFRVAGEFPKLTRATLPRSILSVQYEIDIDQITIGSITAEAALNELGVL